MAHGEPFADYIGRTEQQSDLISASPLRRLSATLDHDVAPWRAGEVPPLGHWLFFLPEERQSALGSDGHAALGDFLPHLDLPRRMWAESRVEFLAPLSVGAQASRITRIGNIQEKQGRTGRMIFVTLVHEVTADEVLCIREEQNLVYREAPKPDDVAPAPPEAPAEEASDIHRTVRPDEVLLFRYSALTFNGHRIHYDSDFTRDVEGYPSLIIHGPLVATMMVDHFLHAHPGADVAAFSFRAMQPMFLGDSLTVHLRHEASGDHRLWVTKDNGSLTAQGVLRERG